MSGLVLAIIAVAFVNVSFAAAVLVLRARNNRRARRFTRIEAKWLPIIIESIAEPGTRTLHVPGQDVRHVLRLCGRLCRRLTGADRAVVRDIAAPLVPTIRDELHAWSPGTRAEAVELISVLTPDGFEDVLLNALDDPFDHVSMVAARALCQPATSSRLGDVLDRIDRYMTWSPQLISAMLADTGSEAAGVLRSYLGDSSHDDRTRAAVALALARLKDPKGAETAAAALSSPDPELVAACLRVIKACGSGKQANAVRRVVDHDEFFVRSEAIAVLSRIGDESDVAAFQAAIAEDVPWVALRAARGLQAFGQYPTLMHISNGSGLAALCAREVIQETT